MKATNDTPRGGLRGLPSDAPEQVRLRGLFEAAISLAGSVSEVGERLGGYAVNAPKHEIGQRIDPARLSHWRLGRTLMPDWTGPALINVIDDLVHDHLQFRDKIAATLTDRQAEEVRQLREAVRVIYQAKNSTSGR